MLNSGIRRTVQWLNGHGFETCDSGDGATHDYGCDRDYPYVVAKVDPGSLVMEADDLKLIMEARGITVVDVQPYESMGERDICIQASYDPGNTVGLIEIMYVTDEMLFGKEGA